MSMTKDNLKIGQEEFNRTKIATLSDRPNVGSAVGGNALSPAQMKKRYDASAELIVQRFNAFIDALAGYNEQGERIEGVADLIQTGLGENYSLANLFAGLSTGEAAQRICVGIGEYSLKGFLEMVLGELDDKLEAARVDVAVEGLEHGQEPTVSWKVTGTGEDKRVLLTFAIPEGKAGKDGKDGSSGVYVGSGPMPEDCCIKVDPGEEDGDSHVVCHTFTVNQAAENDYLVSTDGEWNESGGARWLWSGDYTVWRYPIEDAGRVTSALWHGHTAACTLLEVSLDGEDWVTVIDNGEQYKGWQNYRELTDFLDVASSAAEYVYVRVSVSSGEEGAYSCILNDIPITLDVTYGLLNPYALPEVSAADDGKWLRVVDGQWRAVGGENVVSRVESYKFTVGDANELKYLDAANPGTFKVADDGKIIGRFVDKTAVFIYRYHLANSSQIRGLVWSAECGQQLKLEVSYDGERWTEIKLPDGETIDPTKGRPVVSRSFDLIPYMGTRGLLCYDELYIRISDADTSNGWGGIVRGDVHLRTERFELPFGF